MLRKVQKMASDVEALRSSAAQKLAEFRRLGYPLAVRRGACTYVATTSGEGAWIGVRSALEMAR